MYESTNPSAAALSALEEVLKGAKPDGPTVEPMLRAATLLAASDATAIGSVFRHALRLGRIDLALAALNALDAKDVDAGVRMERATIHARLGDLAAARDELAALEKTEQDALGRARTALLDVNLRVRWDETPIDDATRIKLLATLDGSERVLRTVLENDPLAAVTKTERAVLLTARALVALRANRPVECERILRDAMGARDSETCNRHWWLGDALWAQGRHDHAKDEWQKALAMLLPRTAPEFRLLEERASRVARPFR
jgi:tetratricopeptide (TPR) repeat protein